MTDSVTALAFADRIRELAESGRVVAGIAGEPGVGKSTFATGLAIHLGDDTIVLPMDGFHLTQQRLVELGRRDRMGAPDTFDVDAFVRTLHAVRADDNPVDAPDFDRDREEPVPGGIRIEPHHRVVLVDGNYLLHDADGWEAVRPLLDLTVFLTLDPEVRRERLVDRHIRHGKTPEAAHAWTHGPDETNAILIRACANRADMRVAVD